MVFMKDSYSWLKDIVPEMIDLGRKISIIDPDVFFDVAGTWPVVKLGILSYYADIYTKIINKQIEKGNMTDMIFIDLLAGSGVTKIKSYNCCIPGSTILLTEIPKIPFSKYIAVDNKEYKLQTLNKRFKRLSPNLDLILLNGDCNRKIDEVCNYLTDTALTQFFTS